jgi:dolichyl-diphosphooligosaccharide--protein glycosyltransferase
MGSSPSWVSPLVKITVLALVFIIAFSSRLFAIIRFESIIHEFDPWYGHGR